MAGRLRFTVAVVDEARDLGQLVESAFPSGIAGCPVIAYAGVDSFMNSLERRPLNVPLIVVADSAAREPSVADGVFVRANRLVPHCRGIYLSSNPKLEDCEAMMRRGVLQASFARGSPEAMEGLQESVDRRISEFRDQLEYHVLMRFASDLASTPLPDRSAIESYDDDLSPRSMLIEMARGTPLGKEYLKASLLLGEVARPGARAEAEIEWPGASDA